MEEAQAMASPAKGFLQGVGDILRILLFILASGYPPRDHAFEKTHPTRNAQQQCLSKGYYTKARRFLPPGVGMRSGCPNRDSWHHQVPRFYIPQGYRATSFRAEEPRGNNFHLSIIPLSPGA
jgi:hypothetical protein